MVRNSTDTAYFQRLRPYPRILLRRLAARFKDYDKSPIGFGIVVFCIVKDNCRYASAQFEHVIQCFPSHIKTGYHKALYTCVQTKSQFPLLCIERPQLNIRQLSGICSA